ncbi:MAG TPA: hypothetical protein DC017_05100 [Candidatus Wallbacteria bacterium]|nr:hypothetical protein [Candidatus Wallbacteria bacterium]
MAECEIIGGCLFFNDKMSGMSAVADMMKKKYCKGDNGKCARYMVFKALGRPAVPADLFPNQTDVADKLIKSKK